MSKECNKVWDKEGCMSIEKCNTIGDCRECKNVYATGWKAALTLVRDILVYESSGPSNPVDLMEWLFKELGDE